MAIATTPSAGITRRPAFPALLTRYLAGQIADAQWEMISEALDTTDADPSERAAYAAFCADAASREELLPPAATEMKDLLAITRA
jgi:hypothetical protein